MVLLIYRHTCQVYCDSNVFFKGWMNDYSQVFIDICFCRHRRPPRQGIPFPLRPLYLLDFRKFRAGSWDTFGTIEDCDIAQNSRCRLLQKKSAPAVRKSIYERRKIVPVYGLNESRTRMGKPCFISAQTRLFFVIHL